ncbi:PadR family transcriptional regulator [Mesobacillus selenatarsenatis]|uniref:Transcriptional regulator, PadR family n=1 Tax=Mesobacillus selenatarsenatis (strain DSM 18680 / JCM 14380 / FERM P-15431 / SF-1) TaxID=1321606 RepID=A0A0A8WZQ3_MESS1|nr:PadR family transcriptional regulator [Mesobacillus selenatarsenatis]GAM12434.1 transcriptional regulator, PadR family [Mesobacillus selenatarsenatis SF-1]
MEERLNKLRKSMEKSTFKELSFSEKMRKEIHKQINMPDESDDLLTVAILQLLLHEKTGYELKGLLRSRGFKKFEANEGSVYTMLHTLEQKRLIASCWNSEGTKFYQIIDKGRKYLRKQEKESSSGRIVIKGVLEE